jgi:hypothetical protein
MKAKLSINKEGDYTLSHHPSGWGIGSTNHEWVATHKGEQIVSKLSKQNCDEIFRVLDVEKLANEYCTHEPKNVKELRDVNLVKLGFRDGFNKAMELNKDKLFTEDQMKMAYGRQFDCSIGEFIQSLQQPTEIEIEIEMEQIIYPANMPKEGEERPAMRSKLDAEGCLVLRKL